MAKLDISKTIYKVEENFLKTDLPILKIGDNLILNSNFRILTIKSD